MYPTLVRKTRNENPNCSPSPQNKTRGLIAPRFGENKYATRTMTTRPSRPVNLSIVKGYQIQEANQPLKRANPGAFEFPVRRERDPVLDRSVLKLALINIGASRPHALESYRLQRAKLHDARLKLRQLLTSHVRYPGIHEIVIRFPRSQLLDEPAQHRLAVGVGRLVFKSFGVCGAGIGHLFSLRIIQPFCRHIAASLVQG